MLFLQQEKCLVPQNLKMLIQAQSEEILELILEEMSVMDLILSKLPKEKSISGSQKKKIFVSGSTTQINGSMNEIEQDSKVILDI